MDQTTANLAKYPQIVAKHEKDLLAEWMHEQISAPTWRPDLMSEAEVRQQSSEFLSLFTEALQSGALTDTFGAGWSRVREMLASVSRSRAALGYTPSETATFIFALKQPIMNHIRG